MVALSGFAPTAGVDDMTRRPPGIDIVGEKISGRGGDRA
jgi:hypothetical protein